MGTEVADWDSYFLGIAQAVSLKSKDPTKVGAVITTQDHLIVATGFNGVPRRLSSSFEQSIVSDKDEKLCWMVHAEANAVFNAARTGNRTLGCLLYVNKFPCYGCLQAIIQAGFECVYTDDHEYWKNDPLDTADAKGKKFLIEAAKINIVAPNHPDFQDMAAPRLSRSKPPSRRDSAPPSNRHH